MNLESLMFKKLLYAKIIVIIVACYGMVMLYSHFYRLKTSENNEISNVDIKNEKVQIDVYMETKCPDTQIFIDGQLLPVLNNLGKYVSITMYPYGKAQEYFDGENWVFTCQHGPLECQGNTILGCVISMSNMSSFVPYSSCLMKNLDPLNNYQDCSVKYKLNLRLVEDCFQSKKGNDIQHQNALATSNLDPKLKFIPWIIINKVFTNKNQDAAINNLQSLVCSYLKPVPPECK